MVITKQKSIVDTQKIKKIKSYCYRKYQITKEEGNRGQKEQRNYKTVRKQLAK